MTLIKSKQRVANYGIETIVPYENDFSWIDEEIQNMIDCINSDEIPESHMSCENCAYARQRKEYE